MLIYNESRLVPTDVNVMVIRSKDNIGYFFIHRMLYDQAVIIYDLYGDDYMNLCEAITGKRESRIDVDYFVENVPTPINILGPFLLLVNDVVEDFEDMVGAIHAMSGPMNLRKMLKIPYEMRNTPTFSLSIREEYQLAWDRFKMTTIPYSEDMFLPNRVEPMNGTRTSTEVVETKSSDENTEGLSNIGDDGVEYADALEALLYGSGDDLFDLPSEPAEEEEKETESAPAAKPTYSAPAPATKAAEPVPEEDTEGVDEAPKSGLDLILGGLV